MRTLLRLVVIAGIAAALKVHLVVLRWKERRDNPPLRFDPPKFDYQEGK